MQDRISPLPRPFPFLIVEENAVHVPDLKEGFNARLFGGLVSEEIARRGGEDDADGEIGMVGECVKDVRDFDGGYGAAGCEEEVVFSILRMVRGFEGGVKGPVVVGVFDL